MKPFFYLLLTLTVVVSAPAYATETQMSEREHLARILHELNAIRPIVISAQRAPKDPGRTRFKYQVFLRELKLVTEGLEEYIHGDLDVPRETIEPLSGSYTH